MDELLFSTLNPSAGIRVADNMALHDGCGLSKAGSAGLRHLKGSFEKPGSWSRSDAGQRDLAEAQATLQIPVTRLLIDFFCLLSSSTQADSLCTPVLYYHRILQFKGIKKAPKPKYTKAMVMEEIKQTLGVHPRMPNWETHHMGTGQSLVSPSLPAVQITLLSLHASR